jgi:fatty acid desaturase
MQRNGDRDKSTEVWTMQAMSVNSTAAAVRRPHLPSELHRLDGVRATLCVARAVGAFVVSSVLAGVIVMQDWPLAARVACAAPLILLSGHGLHMMAFSGHEGVHFNLHRNKRWSALLAILISAPVPTYMVIGYGVTHWGHHRFTNRTPDPDTHIYSALKTFWSRVFWSRSHGTRTYFRDTILLALRRLPPKEGRMPLPGATLTWLARVNIAVVAAWVAFYLWFTIRYPLLGAVGVWLPAAFAYYFSGLRAYVEHAGTTVGPFHDTRSYTHWVYTLLFAGNNFHIEHHLYPGVPCYNLAAAHRYLRDQGALAQAGADVQDTFWGIYRFTTSRYLYPGPTPVGADDDDPFEHAPPSTANQP